ncbi:MAG: BrnA antitoxin family protein [Gammaproteobacteria bacterium]|nr:BrnA antitoxin family protein [Gammaproteobacteria bacterium]
MREEYDFSKGKRGPVIASSGKTRITIMLDNDVIETFRARAEANGIGYQTAINEALRAAILAGDAPLTEKALRRILHEELRKAG